MSELAGEPGNEQIVPIQVWQERWAEFEFIANSIIHFKLMIARKEEEAKELLRSRQFYSDDALAAYIIMPPGTVGQTSRAYADEHPAPERFMARYPQEISSSRMAFSDEIGTWLEIFNAPDLISIEPILPSEPDQPVQD